MDSVSFNNQFSATIQVAYMFRDWGCQNTCGDRWNVKGWIILSPGERQVRSNPTENRYFFYYAEGGGRVWKGNYPAEVHRTGPFAKCTCLGVSQSHGTSPWYTVGMRRLDLENASGVRFEL